jgi:Fe-S-cluster containining protein
MLDLDACRDQALRALALGSSRQAALQSEWRTHVRPRTREWWRILQHLGVRRRYDLRFLRPDDLTVDVLGPAGCSRCDDTCCAAPHQVSLRLFDVARLLDAGLGEAMVSPRWSARADWHAQAPELAWVERQDSFRHFPVLRQTEQGVCVFLDAQGQCVIYPLRPLACQRFPYVLGPRLDRVVVSHGCDVARQGRPLSSAETETVLASVLAHHRAKVLDLLWLAYGRPELVALGYGEWLSGLGPRRGKRSTFAEVLAAKRAPTK